MPCLTRWETTARATSAPFELNASIQSLSTMPAFLASTSLIHTIGPPRDKRQHQQVVGVGGVDAPFLVRGDEIEHHRLVAVRPAVEHRLHRLGVDRRAIDAQRLAERAHPQMILVELLAAGQRAPGDQLVHVGVAGVVADLLRFQSRPDRRGDDLARLRHDVAKADLLVLLRDREMGVVAPGESAQRLPRLDGDFTVGLRRQRQHHFRRVDVGVDLRADPWSAPPRSRRR